MKEEERRIMRRIRKKEGEKEEEERRRIIRKKKKKKSLSFLVMNKTIITKASASAALNAPSNLPCSPILNISLVGY